VESAIGGLRIAWSEATTTHNSNVPFAYYRSNRSSLCFNTVVVVKLCNSNMQCSSGFSARGAAVPTTPLWLRHWACISPYYYFIETMSVSRTDSEIFSVKEWRRDLENGGRGRSRSLKMTPFDRSYDFLLVRHFKYSCMLYHFQVNWRWIIVTLKRSFKLVPFDSLGAVSYSSCIVTMAISLTVYEIFSVKV